MDPLDETANGMPLPPDRAGSSFGQAIASTSNADPLYPLTEDDMLGLFLHSTVPQVHSFHPHQTLPISAPVATHIPDYNHATSDPAGTPVPPGVTPVTDIGKLPEVSSMDAFSLPNSLSASLRALDAPVATVAPILKEDSAIVLQYHDMQFSNKMACETSPVSCATHADPSEIARIATKNIDCKKSPRSAPRTPRRPIERRHYRRRKQQNILSRLPGIGDPWASDGAPVRAPRDSIVVKGERMLNEAVAENARKEGDALFRHLIHNVCEFTDENKAKERSRLQNEVSEDSSEKDSKIASRIEAKLSRHKKEVYIAALAEQIKNLCEDLCVLKSVATTHIAGLSGVEHDRDNETHDIASTSRTGSTLPKKN